VSLRSPMSGVWGGSPCALANERALSCSDFRLSLRNERVSEVRIAFSRRRESAPLRSERRLALRMVAFSCVAI
jgi:hypothetical protein